MPVTIDYWKSDRTIVPLISAHVGQLHIARPMLVEELPSLTDSALYPVARPAARSRRRRGRSHLGAQERGDTIDPCRAHTIGFLDLHAPHRWLGPVIACWPHSSP